MLMFITRMFRINWEKAYKGPNMSSYWKATNVAFNILYACIHTVGIKSLFTKPARPVKYFVQKPASFLIISRKIPGSFQPCF